ncbi:hypothetical protein [uncultured Winogradskyella sp.]|uniref:hypothetical protein n=1 Tax=uncultured Winogradskyella sp. TaxID=395353 RepID=UPI0026057F4D|nr:hypothetical protein [uncultured Winogradskyella sp.]
MPQTEEELALLKQDSTLILSDHPLDYEFDDAFHDTRPQLSEGQIPEYFTTVPIAQSLPSVNHEELAQLYIPEEDIFFNPPIEKPVTTKTQINNEEDLLHHLLFEAYVLVGKEQELLSENGEIIDPNTSQAKWIFGRKWRPSGTITLWDGIAGTTPGGQFCQYTVVEVDYSGCTDNDGTFTDCPEYVYGTVCIDLDDIQGSYVPLRGAQVLMRQWFTVRQGITDANGNFSTKSLRGRARYVIQWERYHYSIRKGSLFQAETRGPKVKDRPWFKNIRGDDDEYHGMIHTAAHDYYYGDRFGLFTPPENGGLFVPQLKIAARETAPWGVPSSFSHIRAELTFGLLAQIHIKAYGRDSDEIYGTTIHELAHAAHWYLDPINYDDIVQDSFLGFTDLGFTEGVRDNNRRLLETWTTTVETLFTRRRYLQQFNVATYAYRGDNLQNQTLAEEHYTSAGIDMVEGNYGLPINNQSLFLPQSPIDRVNGYTLNQLEDALNGSNSWGDWRNRIFNIDLNNPTRNNLVELFNNWQ